MKLGVWVDQIYVKSNDNYSTDETFIKFILSFYKYFEKINFVGRVTLSETPGPYLLNHRKNNLVELPFYKNLVQLCIQYPLYINRVNKKLENFVKDNDIIFICIPHPIALKILYYSRKHNKKVFIFVRQNYRKYILIRYKGIKHYLGRLVALVLEYLTDKYCKRYPVIAFGSEIYKKYAQLNYHTVSFADSRWNKNDIIQRNDLKDIDWTKRIHLLFVGRIDYEKGLHYLLEALAKIETFDFKLSIVGEGPLKDDLIKKCNELNIDEKVKFLGYIAYGDRLYKQYMQADLFVLPSTSEGLPQVILEAMIKGVLVLASRTGGIPDIVEHSINGFLFEPGNTKSIFDLLQYLYRSRVDLTAVRANALETVSQFSMEKQHKIFENVCFDFYGLRF